MTSIRHVLLEKKDHGLNSQMSKFTRDMSLQPYRSYPYTVNIDHYWDTNRTSLTNSYSTLQGKRIGYKLFARKEMYTLTIVTLTCHHLTLNPGHVLLCLILRNKMPKRKEIPNLTFDFELETW